MMMKRTIRWLTLGGAVTLAGCMTLPVSLAPSSTPIAQGQYTVIGPTTGRAYGIQIAGFPLSEPNQAGVARDRAVRSKAGDAIVNVAMDMTQITLGPVTIIITTVYGDAVRTAQ